MDSQEQKNKTALVPAQATAVVPVSGPGYWARAQRHYKRAFRVIALALALFLILFTAVNFRVFSYDSLYYFFRDVRALSSHSLEEDAVISYGFASGDSTVLSFGGGVALVGETGIAIYAADGERLLEVEQALQAPRAVASRRYLLAYESGGSAFAVCNAHARLYRAETEYPILAAAVSDSGHFALITSSNEALSQVLLYDGNFNLIEKFSRASATVSAQVSDNGKWIALLGAGEMEGNIGTLLDIYRIGAKEPSGSVRLAGEFPLALEFTNDSNMAVLTDRAVHVYNADAKHRETHLLSGAVPVAFCASEEGFVLAAQTDALTASNRVLACDKKGKILCDTAFTGDITAVSIFENAVFVLDTQSLTRIETKDGSVQALAVAAGATALLAVNARTVRVAYPAQTVSHRFE